MLTIIIMVVLFGGVSFYKEHKEWIRDWEDCDLLLMATSLGICFGAILGLGIAFALPMKTESVQTTYNLEALKDNGSISGSFFLGSGQIDGEMKYIYYYEEDGYYKMGDIDNDKAKIKYVDGDPYIEEYKLKAKEGAFINYFAFDNLPEYTEYIIYIPKGSIKRDYKLDAE